MSSLASGSPQHLGRGGTTRVASFNIRTSRGRDGRNRWRRRRETCLAAIRGFAADVAGLQEVRPDQLEDLRRAFPVATVVGPGVEASAAWIGRDRPGGALPSDHWPVLADLVVS
jgi:endonuclease/exonuclease/phosphatase family metal-dependent hydrolase